MVVSTCGEVSPEDGDFDHVIVRSRGGEAPVVTPRTPDRGPGQAPGSSINGLDSGFRRNDGTARFPLTSECLLAHSFALHAISIPIHRGGLQVSQSDLV